VDERIERELAKQPCSQPEKAELAAWLRADMASYVQGMSDVLSNPQTSVCFVFEATQVSPALLSADELFAKMAPVLALAVADQITWLVIPTRSRGADPIFASWTETLQSMANLGLQQPLLGGCYSVVDPDNQFVRPTSAHNWSCVNQVRFAMIDSKLFKPVGVLDKATYFLPSEPNK
jgi:hypothetical protein